MKRTSTSIHDRLRRGAMLGVVGLSACACTMAQNLIPNGSFEEFWNPCENGSSYDFLNDWIQTSCAFTPGLLAECYDDEVPQSSIGYQEALDGEAFIILNTFVEFEGPFAPGNNPLTYAYVLLTEPLVADQRYCLRLGVNLVDSSCYRTSKLNAFFWYGTTSRCTQNDTLWDDYAQVTFDISEVDTSGWTIMEGDFIAEGGENSLTLGAFQFGSEIDTVFIGHFLPILGDMARYFVDDIQLVACNGVGEVEHSSVPVVSILGTVTQGILRVRSTDQANVPFQLYTIDGRLVQSGVLGMGENALDVIELAAGVHLLRTVDMPQRFVVLR